MHGHRIKLFALLCLLCQFAANGWAQGYPAKSVRMVVPSSPGSGFDVIGRIVAAGLSEAFGQQVIVENRAGAASNVGTEAASRAPADGYTLLVISATHAVNASLYPKLGYKLLRDFAPVSQLASSPSVVVVHPSLPVKSIADLVKLAKARPGAMNYASTGVGGSTHMAAELFKRMADVNVVHVPYRGGGESLTAVVSGEAQVYFAPFATALPQIREGRLRPLAVTSARRLPLLPDYPTVAESGYPGYEVNNWYGIVVPAKTPKEIITVIHDAVVAALKNPTVSKRLSALGYVLVGDQPGEFTAHITSELEKFGKILRELGVATE